MAEDTFNEQGINMTGLVLYNKLFYKEINCL